ncbi:hypothetical protein X765_19095 [Mesorhizobium sp. LSHC440B00]|nr:hypothetical protein X770_19810 [Mesorhizobium sp. LSJC269B00]ESX28064.1 hypothetical protein X765_19095 [Mesorhizobium sp. LSHC440B00]ESX40594.1 hypothetical protein X764_18900 [Mesorhizobium sp. LSHC440A00]ESX72719.1 hypothetical protein X757_21245 [Mesorhizobium sp. LSHC414A00]ESZ34327.1 hypothetical protein X733_11550 [Mesorhizobium sp. L2C067A000]ESZ54302.1 hypothetical protein X728_31725 [Mesorhizobium sp. L103C120A0]
MGNLTQIDLCQLILDRRQCRVAKSNKLFVGCEPSPRVVLHKTPHEIPNGISHTRFLASTHS